LYLEDYSGAAKNGINLHTRITNIAGFNLFGNRLMVQIQHLIIS
jgi:hypothetical protein